MMNKDEAVQKLSKVARISVAYAEDLYDSFFEKPVVPQYVADWYGEHKEYLDYNIWEFIKHWDMQPDDEFKGWMFDDNKNPIITLVNMHQFGYEVEKEARYTVRLKWLYGGDAYLTDKHFAKWCDIRSDREEIKDNLQHTRKELEDADFGWVFDCPGVEVKEVEQVDLLELKKAEEIRQQIEELEKFINYKLSPLDKVFIIKQEPTFKMAIKTRFFFEEKTMVITSKTLSDAINDALKQTIKNLKTQLVDLGIEVDEVE